MITCHRCGTANQDDHQFCPRCGAQLHEPSRSGATVTAPEGERPAWVADPVGGLRIRNTLIEYELPTWRRETTIGRDKTCDIVLASAAVSALHCSIERQAGGASIAHDRGSKNGILTDGAHRRIFELTPGTLFMAGNVPLVAFSAGMQRVRERVQRYLGYDEAQQRGVEDALDATGRRRHVLLRTAAGGQAERLARLIHDAGPGARQPFQVAAEIPEKRGGQRALFSAAANGTLMVGVDELPRDLVVFRECLRSESFNVRVVATGSDPARALGGELVEGLGAGHAASVRMPALAERSDADRLRLIEVVSSEISARIGAVGLSPVAYLPGLISADGPATLDELEIDIERLLTLEREGGNQRAAARILGIDRRWFKRYRDARR
jgi:hypothetical protein